MNDVVEYLKLSLEDDFFSKGERKSLRALVDHHPLDEQQLAFLRGKIFELADQKITPQNYNFILAWIKDATSALLNTHPQGAQSDAYFSPGDACRNVIIKQIQSAVSNLQICVFTISDNVISDSILFAHRKGLNIKIITDNDKSLDEGSDIEAIAKAGIPVKMDRTSNHMHHKFMVADNKTVITGSYNWTRSAAKFNHENILLTNESSVVKSFLKEFDQLWKVMADY